MSPDTRHHRGAHPEDRKLFGEEWLERLRTATLELSWLLGRGYSAASTVKLVGDRHRLSERQRLAVSRAACSDAQRGNRAARCLPVERARGEDVIIDGFNLIITLEAALGGGVLIGCRDGCLRDLSSVHGSYRSVDETEKAILLAGQSLERLAPRSVLWLLDKPVSNSGRLAARIEELAAPRGWPWKVDVVFSPDHDIASSSLVAVSSDSVILDSVTRWINLAPHLIEESIPDPWIIDLNEPDAAAERR